MATGVYILYLILVIIAVAFGIQTAIRLRARNKILAVIVGRERKGQFRLVKPVGQILPVGRGPEEIYNIDTERIIIVDYPFFLPAFLQVPIPCSVYAQNNPEPMDPDDVTILPKTSTSKQLASFMNEHVIDAIVQATDEGRRRRIPEWALPAMALLATVIVFFVVYMMQQKIDLLDARLIDISGKISNIGK